MQIATSNVRLLMACADLLNTGLFLHYRCARFFLFSVVEEDGNSVLVMQGRNRSHPDRLYSIEGKRIC